MRQDLTCHSCGSAMLRDVRPDTITYKGRPLEVQQPGWYCTGCTEAVLSGEDAGAAEEAFIRLKADVDGILTPSEVKRIRVKLAISQRQAGALLGGGPRSFQKYESGADWVTRSMANLLRLLDKDPARLGELRDARSTPSTRRRATG